MSMFEHHTREHYSFLRDSYPHMVPSIPGLDKSCLALKSTSTNTDASESFLIGLFERFRKTIENYKVKDPIPCVQLLMKDLERFGVIEVKMADASLFLRQHLKCQMALRKILSSKEWINAFLLSPLQASSFRSCLQQVLETSFQLIHRFHGAHELHVCLVLQTRLKALALQLIAVIHGSNASALNLSEAFLDEVKNLEKQNSDGQMLDELSSDMLKAIQSLTSPKPGSIARVLQPLLLSDESLKSLSTNLVIFLLLRLIKTLTVCFPDSIGIQRNTN